MPPALQAGRSWGHRDRLLVQWDSVHKAMSQRQSGGKAAASASFFLTASEINSRPLIERSQPLFVLLFYFFYYFF